MSYVRANPWYHTTPPQTAEASTPYVATILTDVLGASCAHIFYILIANNLPKLFLTMAEDKSGGPSSEPATRAEMWAWLSFDCATSSVSVVASNLLALLLQDTALAYAGFPGNCPNVLEDSAVLNVAWPSSSSNASLVPTSAYATTATAQLCFGEGEVSCVPYVAAGAAPGSFLCPGLPSTIDECRSQSGADRFQILIPGLGLDPTTYATLFIALAVACQLVLYILTSVYAD